MVGRRFTEAAKHLVAEGSYLDPGGNGGWEGSAAVVTLLLVTPLRRSAVGAGRGIHSGCFLDYNTATPQLCEEQEPVLM